MSSTLCWCDDLILVSSVTYVVNSTLLSLLSFDWFFHFNSSYLISSYLITWQSIITFAIVFLEELLAFITGLWDALTAISMIKCVFYNIFLWDEVVCWCTVLKSYYMCSKINFMYSIFNSMYLNIKSMYSNITLMYSNLNFTCSKINIV